MTALPARPAQPQPRSTEQATQGYLDLCSRARQGLFIHFVLWMLICVLGDLWRRVPRLCVAMTLLFGLVVVVRLIFERRCAQRAAFDRVPRATVRALMLATPALWGAVSFLTFWVPEMAQVRTASLLIIVGVAASGGMSLVIEPVVRRWWPLLAMGPATVALLLEATRNSYILAAMSFAFALYIQRGSRVVAADYWRASDANAQLVLRTRELELIGSTDALTQVRNRLYFDQQLASEWARAERNGASLALLMIDIDHFKQINDRCGHPFGDICLQATAAALQAALFRPNDLLARYGGEEFIVLLPSIEAAGARAVAERLCAAVAAIRLTHDAQPVPLSCSIGVHTTSGIDDIGSADAVNRADHAMYRAKQQGRNRVVCTSASGCAALGA